MDELELALAAAWIGRLGQHRVAELAQGLDCGPTVAERSDAIVRSAAVEEIDEILIHGFRHHYHQTVYLRRVLRPTRSNSQLLADLERRKERGAVSVRQVVRDNQHHTRALLMAYQDIEFLPLQGGPFQIRIAFPVLVEANGDRLAIHVLTMQSTPDSWGEVVGRGVRRLLTSVRSDNIHDQVLDFLTVEAEVHPGVHCDFSAPALQIITDERVETFSGRFEVGPEGLTRYDTVGGHGRRSLRSAMPIEYDRLISSERITRVEVRFSEAVAGMEPDAQAILYPTSGKVLIRALLRGGDLLEFVTTLA